MARYRAIAADLAAKIRDGHYAPGEALPAQRELSAAYGVTLMTLRQALQELVAEGLAREVIRRVQNLRKEAGLNLDDRIVTSYQAEGELAKAIEAWHDYIAAETPSTELRAGPPAKGDTAAEDSVSGHSLKLGVHTA